MFGSRIADLRRSMGLTQASLAKQLNISSSALGMYEQGRREPPLDLIVTLSETFGVSIDYLLTGCTSLSEDSNTLYELLVYSARKAFENNIYPQGKLFLLMLSSMTQQ